MGVGRRVRVVRRRRFTVKRPRVPTLLFVPTVTFTFKNLATVLVLPEVVVPTVLVRVFISAVLVTPGPRRIVACRSRPTTLVLLGGRAMSLRVTSIIPSF